MVVKTDWPNGRDERQVQLVLEGLQPLSDFSIQLGDELVEEVDMRQMHAEQQTVVFADAAAQGPLQLLAFATQLASGQVRQRGRIGGAADDGCQHGSSGYAHDVGGYASKFEVGI